VTIAPGKIGEVYFGDTDYPLISPAQTDARRSVILRAVPGIFMPLMTREE
jgi:hypothetical protein